MVLASWILLLGSIVDVTAFPSFRNKIPNGFRVACPTDAEGCSLGDKGKGEPDSVCNGIGHRTCGGATMPLNPFGKAMEDHKYIWSKSLCNEDSDGDGLTNGEELGDPCCLWEEHDTASAYTRTFNATHPGVASSTLANYVRPDCTSTAPEKKATKLNYFNSWEEQRRVEVFVENYTIPTARTTYVDIAWNFPDDSEDLFHAVFAEAIVRNPKNLHHYVVRGCPFKWPAQKHGKTVTRSASSRCSASFGGWAPGKNIVETPPWLGRPLGKKAGIESFVVSVHYDNPSNEAGGISNDGMRIYYTPTLRSETMAEFAVSQISYNPQMQFPPGRSRNFVTRSCSLNIKDEQGRPAEFHLSSMSYHAHLLGRQMFTELTQDGKTIDLGSEKIWHFDDQYTRNLLPMNITLRTGDHIQGTCILDSTERRQTTVMGLETTDEMCWVSFQGWPGDVDAKCSGNIWIGELSASEPGFGLAQRHPVDQANYAWDGTNVRQGGNLLSKQKPPSVCSDGPRSAPICPMLVEVLLNQSRGEAACSAELSQVNEALAGQTALTICCTEACKSLCPNHELCPSAAETTAVPVSAALTQSNFIVCVSLLLLATITSLSKW